MSYKKTSQQYTVIITGWDPNYLVPNESKEKLDDFGLIQLATLTMNDDELGLYDVSLIIPVNKNMFDNHGLDNESNWWQC